MAPSKASYVDTHGVAHQLLSGFTKGDIVLLTDDQYAFRYDKAVLANASAVFRSMFANHHISGTEIHLPTSAHLLEIFLRALKQPTPLSSLPNWDISFAIIDLARQYDCVDVARDLIHTAALVDPVGRRIDAFVLACELDHLQAACRLLQLAHSGEDHPYRKTEKGKGRSLRPSHSEWTQVDAARISSPWLWALTSGVYWAQAEVRNPHEKPFWVAVVGQFMACLTRCEFSIVLAGTAADFQDL